MGNKPGQGRRRAIWVEFIGGPDDRRLLFSASTNQLQTRLVNFFYDATEKGTVGKRAMAVSEICLRVLFRKGEEAVPQVHVYEVVERTEELNEIWIRMKYVGLKDKCGPKKSGPRRNPEPA